MSSGFVSAGTDQQPVERDDEWLRAQNELEDERRRKAELGRQDGGKSLYEVLEQNKMAKQDAFEEKVKLKNQFRSLDEDEIDFLDSIMESTRAQEAAVKKETAEQLELFRRQREEAEKTLLEEGSTDVAPAAEGEDWKIPARKRRRDKNKDLLIPGKKRKSTTEMHNDAPLPTQQTEKDVSARRGDTNEKSRPSLVLSQETPKQSHVTTAPSNLTSVAKETGLNSEEKPAAKPPPASLGLAGYDSDSE
ncbi:hypothetical protein FE257_012131 [Aspergillus nanangensis]|uniref:FAM192A/Fyv6 N-terminal domain-containing protein n=1 Tax=Aspergillus nanangensis TaxID=2582783 RepID=A0AAD4GQX6_ASPNN|nr:hypothetical protein FE257_012131 [Aspergillus nanangensis]